MTILKFLTSSLWVLFVLGSCTGSGIPEEAFDTQTWKNDPNGCNSERLTMLDQFKGVQDKIIGLSELQVNKLLGKPDKVELYIRSQKFYVYHLKPGSQCNAETFDKAGENIQIRFNSLNEVNEIIFNK
ncbi:hypothetical protein [Flexithrix dorotheae]|uniref:hypothetical protein n=1 Tax=Flexithrix dorotheae TaxID=70993 RepID=UPI0012FB6968|nr:hypothetical protein [Flexithrix dorotheae]